MSFILIPLVLIIASIGGIFFILWRKLSHLETLAALNAPTENFSVKKDWRGFICEFCPEVLSWVRSIKIEGKIREYKELWLIETEKFLRRLRVVSLKTDRLSDALIKKIRRNVSYNGSLTYAIEEKKMDEQFKPSPESEKNEKDAFKKSEQRLILEIAKNPKNAVLYEELGDLYSKSGDYKDAKESYEAAIELSPQNEELKKKLSQAFKKLNPPK